MNSFSKVIQPKPASFFNTNKPLWICGFHDADSNDAIGSSISIPGNFDVDMKCVDARVFQPGLSYFINDLHARNHQLISKQRTSKPPTNYEYNLANLMNLHFDARTRGDFNAAHRFQQHINILR